MWRDPSDLRKSKSPLLIFIFSQKIDFGVQNIVLYLVGIPRPIGVPPASIMQFHALTTST